MSSRKESDAANNKSIDITKYRDYQLRPKLNERFQVNTVKDLIGAVLSDNLLGKTYSSDEVEGWTVHISRDIKNKVIELGLNSYKFVVSVTLGEQRGGGGVRISSRALWDADTDAYASHLFVNDTIFCMAVVFGIFVY